MGGVELDVEVEFIKKGINIKMNTYWIIELFFVYKSLKIHKKLYISYVIRNTIEVLNMIIAIYHIKIG